MMIKESLEALRKVFDSIDKDRSGFIDKQEVQLLAKELGQEVKEADIESIFGQMDTNKDGKISFEEFLIWWRNGAPTKMEKMVYMQLKANKLLNKAHVGLTRIGASLESKYDNVEQSYVALKCGDASDPQTYVHVHGGVCLKDETKRTAIVTELGLKGDEHYIVLSFETPQAEMLHKELKDIWETVKGMLEAAVEEVSQALKFVDIQFQLKGDRVLVILKAERFAAEMYEAQVQSILTFVSSLNISLDFSANVNIKTTLKHLLENDLKPYKLLTDGFLVEGKVNFSKVVSQKLREEFTKRMAKKFETSKYLSSDKKMALSLAMISSVKLVLNFTMPEVEAIMNQVGESIGMNPDDQIPSVNTLLDMGRGMAEGPISDILEELPVGEQLKNLLKNVDHTRTDLYVLAPKSYVHVSSRIPGHKEILERILP